jgi:hypothetical protein
MKVSERDGSLLYSIFRIYELGVLEIVCLAQSVDRNLGRIDRIAIIVNFDLRSSFTNLDK